MSWKRAATRCLADIYSWGYGNRVRPGFRILLYHAVGSRLPYDSYGISIRPDLFEQHMRTLAKSSYLKVVSFEQPEASNLALQLAVTFDDGYKDNLYIAAPILLKYQIPFTVFVTSAFIQSGSSEYLTPDELRELAALPGATIGAHGATHTPLTQCDDGTLWQELYESRCYLEDILGQTVTTLAYPNGATDLRVRTAAQQAGYRWGGCSRFDINYLDRDPLLLCRCEILATDSVRIFRQKLNGVWDWYRWRAKDPAAV